MEENSQTVVDDSVERSVESCGYSVNVLLLQGLMEENSQTVVDDTVERSVESCGYSVPYSTKPVTETDGREQSDIGGRYGEEVCRVLRLYETKCSPVTGIDGRVQSHSGGRYGG